MFGIRQKVILGFAGLLIIILIIGIQSISTLGGLGESIDVILRENYRSVIACQEMKEGLERIDSGLLFTLLGDRVQGEDLISKNQAVFEKALQTELNNITVPGEGEAAEKLRGLYAMYQAALPLSLAPDRPLVLRHDAYFASLFPLFGQIKAAADDILQMNQRNMSEANDRARFRASQARSGMYVLLAVCTLVALAFMHFTGRWILWPVRSLTLSADEIRKGNLDLVVPSNSRDELGLLAESFNAMASSLRELRRTDQARLLRVQRATQEAFDRLPDAVAVVDIEGRVEVSTESAKTVFGLIPGAPIFDLPYGLSDYFKEALAEGRPAPAKSRAPLIQRFVNGEERFYRPEAVPIRDANRRPTGAIMVLHDVTQLRQQDELKTSVIRAVSHQLKTPLTSVRMAIHLLLEEKIGGLTEKQAEVLMAAREDSDRLHEILANLLDLSRMESGRAKLDFQSFSPQSLVMDALEPIRQAARDKGIALGVDVHGVLADVWTDRQRTSHVFANLLANALRHTPSGGRIFLGVKEEESAVRFIISDTGEGIPEEYLDRIFEPFFRVPGRESQGGAGLGLSTAKEIVEAQGGMISVESREGGGTTVSFSLRRADRIAPKESPDD
jgi:NtrC-family two-component system sensor histidine kinase KinB